LHRSGVRVDRCWHVKIYSVLFESSVEEGSFSLFLSLFHLLSLVGIPESMTLRLGRVIIQSPDTRRRAALLRIAIYHFLVGKVSAAKRSERSSRQAKERKAALPRATTRMTRNGTERSTHARTHARTHAGMHARTHECAPLTTTGRLRRTPVQGTPVADARLRIW